MGVQHIYIYIMGYYSTHIHTYKLSLYFLDKSPYLSSKLSGGGGYLYLFYKSLFFCVKK